MAAEALPFLLGRGGAGVWAGIWGGGAVSATFWRFDRLVEAVDDCWVPGVGLVG